MQRAVQNGYLGVQIGVIVLIALFAALGINGIVASVLAGLTPGANVKPVAAPDPDKDDPKAAETNNLIFNRNLFNQTAEEPQPEATETTADTAAAEDEPALPEAPPPAPGAPVESDLKVLLVGTQVADDPRWSLAILKNLESGGADSDALYRRVGTTFMEDATIVHIARDRVYFKRHSAGDRIEYLDIEATPSDVMARARKTETKPEEPEAAKGADKPAEKSGGDAAASRQPDQRVARSGGSVDPNAIQSLGQDTFGIPRDMAETVRDNPKMLQDPKFGQPPQIQPVYRGGTVNGFRVLGVAPESVYGMLGIRSGDIIVDVNGQIVDNPQKALAFFDQLNPGTDVQVKINRKGRHKTLTYKLN